jgi:nicotinate dehydrogenase FAD-subunit
MEPFGYIRAKDTTEAVFLLNEPGIKSRPLAGSTDLILILKRDPLFCDRVIDISQIPELHEIKQENGWITLGAAVTFCEVIESPLIAQTAQVLSQACRQIGAVQVRNMGTVGGNVANAAACADSLPALVCLDAIARVKTPEGEFEWPVSEFIQGPNRTVLPLGGLLVSLRFPIPCSGSRSVFQKLGRRNAMAISRLTFAALGCLDDSGRIAEARLVPGSAMPQIIRLKAVEAHLIGQTPQPELFQSAAQMAVDEVVRIAGWRWSSEYKVPALHTMIMRALQQVFANSRASESA